MKNIPLRIHHLMCIHGFSGKGYSPEFVRGFWSVLDRLKEGNPRIELVGTTEDEICKPCPNNVDGVRCEQETKIRSLDGAYAQTLGVKVGDSIAYSAATRLVGEKVSFEDFEKNCDPCQWKKLGVCRDALAKLKNSVLCAFVLLYVGSASFAQEPAVTDVSPEGVTNPESSSAVTPPQAVASPSPSPSAAPAIEALDKNKTEPDILTVHLLEQKVLFDKTKRTPAFYKALNALNKEDYTTALASLRPLAQNAEFLDYYHFLSGRAQLGRTKKSFAQKQYAAAAASAEKAVQHFMNAIGSNAYTSVHRRSLANLGEAEAYLAECYYKNKKTTKSIQLFESGFQRLSQTNLMALIPKQGIVSYAIQCEKKPNDICVSWTAKLAPLMVKTENAKLIERIAAFKRTSFDKSSAKVTSIPYKVDLDLQAFQKAFASYVEGKYAEAFSQLNDLLKEYPRTTIKLRTKFWMARSAQRAGQQQVSETLYKEVIRDSPFTYYALLSSWFGGIELSRMLDLELPIASTEMGSLSPADIVHIQKAEKFIASAANELALMELQDVRPNSSMPNEFLVYLAVLNHLAGNHLTVFQIFGELSGRSYQGLFSSYGEKIFFPTLSLPITMVTIRNYAKDHKVDALLPLSIIKQESAFNTDAVSVANAYGLMQIIAPTARDLDPKIEIVDLFKPATNAKLGTKYIGQLLNRFDGNVIAALAAYNAGPGNSNRWYREFGAKFSPEEYVEQIGFRETREYVQNILRNYYWYNRRINGESLKDLSSLLAKFKTGESK